MGDELEIRRLLAEYCQLCDDGDFAALTERFAPDGSFVFGESISTGRDELRRWFEVSQTPERRGKHLTVNVVVDVDGDRADVVSDFLFLMVREGAVTPLITGRYHDDLRRVDGRWLFQRREATSMA